MTETNSDINEQRDHDQKADMEMGVEVLENLERGCGYLKHSKGYLHGDVAVKGSKIPPFVVFEEYIPHLEFEQLRSWKYFPGIQFELALPVETVPSDEIHDHIRRLVNSEEGRHVGEMLSANAHDLLMWAGKEHYPQPEDFISEARVQGINKAIPISKNNAPPIVNPGKTRLFIVHPRAIVAPESHDHDYYPGIIGYAYLSRVLWTLPEDSMVPKYIQDYYYEGRIHDIVRVGDEIPRKNDPAQNGLEEYA